MDKKEGILQTIFTAGTSDDTMNYSETPTRYHTGGRMKNITSITATQWRGGSRSSAP